MPFQDESRVGVIFKTAQTGPFWDPSQHTSMQIIGDGLFAVWQEDLLPQLFNERIANAFNDSTYFLYVEVRYGFCIKLSTYT